MCSVAKIFAIVTLPRHFANRLHPCPSFAIISWVKFANLTYKERHMAWIKMISLEEATGALKAMYEKYIEPVGVVDNILRIHSLNPKSLRTHYDLYAHLMRGKSDLSRAQREMIAVVASVANKCHY